VPSNQALIEAVGARHPAWLLLFVVLLAPVYEELLFRRVLFGRLWVAGRPLLGLVLSSAAFACMHELPGTGDDGVLAGALLWTCYAAMGGLFAWVYRRTGTLWAAIGAHAINNLIASALLLAGVH
jgi:membrane protease YdiL (CAAX protease family)